MIAPIATEEERIRLIKECQQSGLTINEWCRRNGIQRNTLHTWMTRLRKKGLIETPATIPAVINEEPYHQDIVKIELLKEVAEVPGQMIQPGQEKSSVSGQLSGRSAVMEVSIGNAKIKVTNQIDPRLLAETIRLLGGVLGC